MKHEDRYNYFEDGENSAEKAAFDAYRKSRQTFVDMHRQFCNESQQMQDKHRAELAVHAKWRATAESERDAAEVRIIALKNEILALHLLKMPLHRRLHSWLKSLRLQSPVRRTQ